MPKLVTIRDDGPDEAEPWRREVAGWPDDLWDAWEERSALRQFDGEETRERAERLAYEELRPLAPAVVPQSSEDAA